MTVDIAMMVQYAELDKKQKDLEAQIKSIKNTKAKAEQILLEQMSMAGVSKMTLDGLGTLYVRSQIWPKFKDGKTRVDVIRAMKEDGIAEDFLKENYNANAFAAYVREVERAGDSLPPHLIKVVEPSEKFNLIRTK